MAIALIVGAGSGLSASLARLFATEGYTIALAALNQMRSRSVFEGDSRKLISIFSVNLAVLGRGK